MRMQLQEISEDAMENSEPSSRLPPDASISQTDALTYWSGVSADVHGMLGGIPEVSRIDLQSSANFLAKLRRAKQGSASGEQLELLERAVDCGAGIGRITKGLLVRHARLVDIVEPVKKFADAISAQLGDDAARLGDIYTVGLESWAPSVHYDLIWNQWCLGQLTDAQLLEYLKRCSSFLKQGGWMVVKENLSNHVRGEDIFDEVDSSVTRADEKFRALFDAAGLKIVATELQRGFPKELFAVRSYALQPKLWG